jgi:dipeptidyl aminopeptidase/acylaminoacyl peptidase
MKSIFRSIFFFTSMVSGIFICNNFIVPDGISVPYIPPEMLFGTIIDGSTKEALTLSPDGAKLAYVAPVDGVYNLWVKTLGSDDDRPVTCSSVSKSSIDPCYGWLMDNITLIYSRYDDTSKGHCLYTVNTETGEEKNLTPLGYAHTHIIYTGNPLPYTILITISKSDEPEVEDMYHLNIISGELKLVEKGSRNEKIGRWLVDAQGIIHGKAVKTDNSTEIWVKDRDNKPSTWKKLLDFDLGKDGHAAYIRLSSDGKNLYLYLPDPRFSNTNELVKVNLVTGERTVLYTAQDCDMSDAIEHPKTREPQAVIVTKAHQEIIALDPLIKGDLDILKHLKHGDVTIVDRSQDDVLWLVCLSSDTEPGAYYLYNRKTTQATLVHETRPDLKQCQLAPMETFDILARDGLKLEGCVTYPIGVERHNLPMVLNVHGGPYNQDRWGYDAEAQWLANRGYVCVQVNFRGSTGYGKTFLNAANKEWGNKMHHDLIDTVNYFIDQGIADPKRIAIYGASYGGYAALCGAAFTPDIFCCAVDVCGPSNLLTFITSSPDKARKFLSQKIGDPDVEGDMLKLRSPFFSVDKIKIPLLIGHGAKDELVKIEQSEQVVESLKKLNIPHEYVVFPDEGHGLDKPENKLAWYAHAEKFLAQHIGGRYKG